MAEPVSIWEDSYRHDTDQVPTDPLLGSDAFIATNDDCANQNGYANRTDRSQLDETPETPKQDQNKPSPVADGTKASRARRSRKTADENERPEWLPEDWGMYSKTRANGASAGTTDRYYVDPASGRRFRSKNEVFHYLETGSKLKKKPTSEASATDTPGKQKEKKMSGSKRKKQPAPWTFDFENVPQEVNWVLIDVSQGLWKPSMADQQIPDSSRKEWRSTFKRICDNVSTAT